MTRTRRLFRWVAEPRVLRTTFFVLYVFHAVAGLSILLAEPGAVVSVLGQWPATAWGVRLTFGGGVGAVAVLPGWNFLERAAIGAIIAGIAMATLLIVAMGLTAVTFALGLLVGAWVVVFGHRLWEIRLYLVAPKN